MNVLTHVEVAVRVFNPAQGLESGETYVLPLDNADAEHGCTFPLATPRPPPQRCRARR